MKNPFDEEESFESVSAENKNKKNKSSYMKGMVTGIAMSLLVGGAVLLTGCLSDVASEAPGVLSVFSDKYDGVAEKLAALRSVIDKYYLDEDGIDDDAMIEGIYSGYIGGLNEPYTVYYTEQQYKDLEESSSGLYSGIGVQITQNMETGIISVIRPFEGSPAQEAGILKDDIIYKVKGTEVTGKDLTEVVSWIKGEESTYVEIEIYRPSDNEYYTLDVERRTIEVPMVEYKMQEDNIGYIEILEFEEPTAKQFNNAVDDLLDQGMTSLIIDLRDNPGGLVNSATDILDRILPKDKLLVYTEDKNGKKEEQYSKDDETLDLPMMVLVNKNSASSSEIVCGCLKDYDVVSLVGTQTFGKGIVQYVIPMSDGSAVKVTAAKYFSPLGRNIHGEGFTPDYEVEDDPETEIDEQLERAREILLGEYTEDDEEE